MPFTILTNTAASITDLKRDPMGTIRSAEGETIAILNRNEPLSTAYRLLSTLI